jgi:hypothetical protein
VAAALAAGVQPSDVPDRLAVAGPAGVRPHPLTVVGGLYLEGLLQTAGLEKPTENEPDPVDERRLEGTTSRQVPRGFWQRYVEHQRRPHAPGVWVVYFSLAALPYLASDSGYAERRHTAMPSSCSQST